MAKSHFGCTITFESEEEIFKFYKECRDYIVSMTVSPLSPTSASFKFGQGYISYIKEKYKDRFIITNGNTYTLKGGD